jgi:DNA-binding transcriptional LysR family regulator
MFDWNDLKHFLAVAREGSTIAAAKVLGVNQSTVHRRLTELEARLGRELVTRHPTGYRLTEFGQTLVAYAEGVESAALALESHVGDAVRDRNGAIRLTCPEPIVHRLMPLIERFHTRHPDLRVEFVTSDRYLDLLKGDADVALRSGDTEDDLVGRKVADSVWAIYASRTYVERHGKPERIEDLSSHRLVGLDDAMRQHRVVIWLSSVAPSSAVVARTNSILGLVQSVRSGLGVGPLPTAIADEQPDLVQVLGPISELSRSWRILTPSDLRHTHRISAFFEFVAEERDALKSILTG